MKQETLICPFCNQPVKAANECKNAECARIIAKLKEEPINEFQSAHWLPSPLRGGSSHNAGGGTRVVKRQRLLE